MSGVVIDYSNAWIYTDKNNISKLKLGKGCIQYDKMSKDITIINNSEIARQINWSSSVTNDSKGPVKLKLSYNANKKLKVSITPSSRPFIIEPNSFILQPNEKKVCKVSSKTLDTPGLIEATIIAEVSSINGTVPVSDLGDAESASDPQVSESNVETSEPPVIDRLELRVVAELFIPKIKLNDEVIEASSNDTVKDAIHNTIKWQIDTRDIFQSSHNSDPPSSFQKLLTISNPMQTNLECTLSLSGPFEFTPVASISPPPPAATQSPKACTRKIHPTATLSSATKTPTSRSVNPSSPSSRSSTLNKSLNKSLRHTSATTAATTTAQATEPDAKSDTFDEALTAYEANKIGEGIDRTEEEGEKEKRYKLFLRPDVSRYVMLFDYYYAMVCILANVHIICYKTIAIVYSYSYSTVYTYTGHR